MKINQIVLNYIKFYTIIFSKVLRNSIIPKENVTSILNSERKIVIKDAIDFSNV